MKKILTAALCLLMLSACGTDTQEPSPAPSPVQTAAPAQPGQNSAVRTMISPSDKSPIDDGWTILGETFATIDGGIADIYLATTAERGGDGYMMWDDSQEWALTVETETETFVLLNEYLHGKLYIDVTSRGETPVISVVQTTTVGLSVTEYVYENGAFYSQAVIVPPGNGNNIYSSIPDYL